MATAAIRTRGRLTAMGGTRTTSPVTGRAPLLNRHGHGRLFQAPDKARAQGPVMARGKVTARGKVPARTGHLRRRRPITLPRPGHHRVPRRRTHALAADCQRQGVQRKSRRKKYSPAYSK